MSRVTLKPHFLYLIAALLSLTLSAWMAWSTYVINPDGICYLQSAVAMEKGLSTAAHLCDQAKWPFYSILIFGVMKLTHLTPLVAAFALNAFFSLVTVIMFIAIVNCLTNNRRVLWLAAFVILLASEFNSIRSDIVRDHGFWAFYLMSLFFLVHSLASVGTHVFHEKIERCYFAILWAITLIIAGLFRIEGMVFLLLLPFLVLFDVRQNVMARISHFFLLNAVTLLGLITFFTWSLFYPEWPLSRLLEVEFQFQHGVTQLIHAFQDTAQALGQHVLNTFSARDANLVTVGMLLSWYIINVLSNVSLIYALLIIYAGWKKLVKWDFGTRLVIYAYILVNILITAIFLVDNLFLAKRYLIALSLILMLWVPFALEKLISEWRIRKWPVFLVVICMLAYGWAGIVGFGYSKKYIREAGDWLAMHAKADEKIYSNDYQLLYYSNHLGNEIFTQGRTFENLSVIADGQWQHYDYLALRFNKNDADKEMVVLREIKRKPVITFQNKRGDEVRIYQVHLKKDGSGE